MRDPGRNGGGFDPDRQAYRNGDGKIRGQPRVSEKARHPQIIRPGELNWMIAGRGVSHSERTSAEARSGPNSLFGMQTWLALPDRDEDMAPSFEHFGKAALPVIEDRGVTLRLILGEAYGEKAPARMLSETFCADVALEAGALLPLPDDHEDRGIYILDGSISVAGQTFGKGQMMVFRPGDRITVAASRAQG